MKTHLAINDISHLPYSFVDILERLTTGERERYVKCNCRDLAWPTPYLLVSASSFRHFMQVLRQRRDNLIGRLLALEHACKGRHTSVKPMPNQSVPPPSDSELLSGISLMDTRKCAASYVASLMKNVQQIGQRWTQSSPSKKISGGRPKAATTCWQCALPRRVLIASLSRPFRGLIANGTAAGRFSRLLVSGLTPCGVLISVHAHP
jgi:hypothetical protein